MKRITLLITTLLMVLTIQSQTWNQVGSDIYPGQFGFFGISTSSSLDGSIISSGGSLFENSEGVSSGVVEIYQNVNNTWVQLGSDIEGLTDATDITVEEHFGYSQDLNDNGNIIAVGAYRNAVNGEGAGAVRVYNYIAGNWEQVGGTIYGKNINEWFGQVVKINAAGTRLVSGGVKFNDSSGVVRVYDFDGTDWVQKGNDILSLNYGDRNGDDVSISDDGSIIAVASILSENGTIENAGNVRVFEFDDNTQDWILKGNIVYGEASGDLFGHKVTLTGDGLTFIAGAPGHNGGDGQVQVFSFDGGIWTQVGTSIDGTSGNVIGDFGRDVTISPDGNVIAAGSWQYSLNYDNYWTGNIKTYRKISGSWIQIGDEFLAGYGDTLGYPSLNYDGSQLVLGISAYDGGYGAVRVYEYSDPASINNTELEVVKIYPNPTVDYLTIQNVNGNNIQEVKIIDVLGKVVFKSVENIQTSKKIDFRKFKSGVYNIIIQFDNNIEVIKILKL